MNEVVVLARHVDGLFATDPRGRLIDARGEAPRFWLGRSRLGNVWRFHADLDEAVVRDLSRVVAREPALEDLGLDAPPPEPERAARIRTLLEDAKPLRAEWRGPLWRDGTALCSAAWADAAGLARARELGRVPLGEIWQLR